MAVTLIGSRALASWFPEFRMPRGDYDWHSDKSFEFPASADRHDVFVYERV